MPFYFLAVRPWVHDMKKVACIEIAGGRSRKNGSKLQDLSDVLSVNDLMHKKAMPIRNISIKYAKDVEKGSATIFSKPLSACPANKDETLGETIARLKEEKKAKKAAFNQYKRTLHSVTPTSTTTAAASIRRRRRSSTQDYKYSDSISSSSSEDPDYVRRQLQVSTETLGETLKRIKEEKKARKAAMAHYKRTLATPTTAQDQDTPPKELQIERASSSPEDHHQHQSEIYISSSIEEDSSSIDDEPEIIHIPDEHAINLLQHHHEEQDYHDNLIHDEDHISVLAEEEETGDEHEEEEEEEQDKQQARGVEEKKEETQSTTTITKNLNQKRRSVDPFECDVDELQEAMLMAATPAIAQKQQNKAGGDQQHSRSNTDATAATDLTIDSPFPQENELLTPIQQPEPQQQPQKPTSSSSLENEELILQQQPQHQQPTSSSEPILMHQQPSSSFMENEEQTSQQEEQEEEGQQQISSSFSSFSSFFSTMESRIANDTTMTSEHQWQQQNHLLEPISFKGIMKVKTLQDSLASITPTKEVLSTKTSSNDSAPARPTRMDSFSDAFGCDSDDGSDVDDDDPNLELDVDVDDIFGSDKSNEQQHQTQPSYPPVKPTFRLEWGQIEIREYQICMGDNPACGQGVPIQLDWAYETTHITFIEVYEHYKLNQYGSEARYPQRISARRRQQMLLEMGYTPSQMKLAIQIKARDQQRRIKTVSRLKYMEFDSKVEKIVRIFPTSTSSTSTSGGQTLPPPPTTTTQ